MEADAVYYRDPDARRKLRSYLASPVNFDEAVAFGFPSTSNTEPSPEQARTPPPTSANDAQTFLKDDAISFINRYDDEDSDDDASDVTSPVTPADHDRIYLSPIMSMFDPLDSFKTPCLHFKFSPESVALKGLTPSPNREMTLRMTLTRPDLRAKNEDLFAWQSTHAHDDALALEELPPLCDDETGAHGVFAVKTRRSSKVLQHLLNRVRREKHQ